MRNRKKHSEKTRVQQGPDVDRPEPNRINASTPFDFSGKNLTPYGGLLPVATMLDKLSFRALGRGDAKDHAGDAGHGRLP